MKYSHPNKTLNVHCREVLSGMNKNTKFEKIIAYGHDFAKLTSYFQNKLKGRLRPEDIKKSQHSYLSALFTYYILKKEGFDNYECILGYAYVFNHHGYIRKIDKMFPVYTEYEVEFEIIEAQLKDLMSSANKKEIYTLYSEIGLTVDIEDFSNAVMEVTSRGFMKIGKDIKRSFQDILNSANKSKFHKDIINNMPTFNKADYYSAGNISLEEAKEELKLEDVLDYISKRSRVTKNDFHNKLNAVRMSSLQEALLAVDKIDILNDLLLSINMFTGGGKTIVSLAVALKLKKLKEEVVKDNVKIVYGIPFINIILQVVEEFDRIMSMYLKDYKDNASTHLLEHFHLSDSVYIDSKLSIDEDDLLTQKLIIDNFESQIIVTTFVQLFTSLFTNKNSNLSKMANLRNSVIILDEVQNVPAKYWGIVELILEFWAREYNIHFILMTATKPMILNNKTKSILDKGFVNLPKSRLNLYFIKKKMSINQFASFFLKKEKESPRDNLLLIFNTVKSSQEFKDLIEKEMPGYTIYLLETDAVPIERNQRLRDIKKQMENGEKVIVISTQLIEAGVDLSFDRIYRDIAGIDNIFQAGGRGNRSFDKSFNAEIIVVKLINEYNSLYGSLIYGDEIMKITESLLLEAIGTKDYIEDKFHFDLLTKRYFEEINNIYNSYIKTTADYLWNGYLEFDAEIMQQFQLIKDENRISLFVETNEEAKQIYEKYKKEVANETDFKKKRNAYLKIRKDFSKYVVNIFEESKDKYVLDIYWDNIIKNSLTNKGEVIDIVSIPLDIVNNVYDSTKNKGKGLLRK